MTEETMKTVYLVVVEDEKAIRPPQHFISNIRGFCGSQKDAEALIGELMKNTWEDCRWCGCEKVRYRIKTISGKAFGSQSVRID